MLSTFIKLQFVIKIFDLSMSGCFTQVLLQFVPSSSTTEMLVVILSIRNWCFHLYTQQMGMSVLQTTWHTNKLKTET